MLTVLEGGGQPDDRLTAGDLPLGPWAGAKIEVWASKTGEVWHGDPDCSQLRGQARKEDHLQPSNGTMADICLPERLHCDPAGALGRYRQAVNAMVRFDAVTCDVSVAQHRGDLALEALDESLYENRLEDMLESEPLAAQWSRCMTRRAKVTSEMRQELEHRLPIMLAALWVENGRTPRKHQPRYTSFLEVAEDECERRGIVATSGVHSFVNSKSLPYWLNDVTSGELPRNVTASQADKERQRAVTWNRDNEEFIANVYEAWITIGSAWERRLEGIVLGHPGEVFAVFHRHSIGLNWELRDIFDTMIPHAELKAGEINWIAAKVPAIFRLFLAERDHGLVGLVLDEEHPHRYTPETAALFLRNLTVDIGAPNLARYVCEGGPGSDEADIDEDVPDSAGVDRRLSGFGTGISDAGITREQCLPALRAALDGAEITLNARPRRPQRSRR